MIPASFEYSSPKTLSEAISLLETSGSDSKILAGGQSLIPLMKLRLGSPSRLIDINNIEGLSYIRESDSFLRIGALTRMADLESSDLIKKKYSVINDAASHIADPTVRNLGTAGGNVSHADPANDLPATMLALGAEFVATGPAGSRVIKAKDFFVDTFTTALTHREILTEIRVPQYSPGTGGAYLKLEKRVGDFAIAGVAVQICLDTDGKVARAGIGLTAVGPSVIQAEEAEQSLLGQKLTEDTIGTAARLAAQASTPSSDLRGPAEYKKEMVKVLTSRALKRAYLRAVGGGA
ncbi:MAG: xanthine dehydrogenase family protein subunit M [archaeon]|jgi:carbon-monoxide dehydrogenase medium subunit|nr:xanthine dehydrogenase family protein subunit M [archaeon]